jgi:hypothetical protein
MIPSYSVSRHFWAPTRESWLMNSKVSSAPSSHPAIPLPALLLFSDSLPDQRKPATYRLNGHPQLGNSYSKIKFRSYCSSLPSSSQSTDTKTSTHTRTRTHTRKRQKYGCRVTQIWTMWPWASCLTSLGPQLPLWPGELILSPLGGADETSSVIPESWSIPFYRPSFFTRQWRRVSRIGGSLWLWPVFSAKWLEVWFNMQQDHKEAAISNPYVETQPHCAFSDRIFINLIIMIIF